jgi:hypothetical protein
MWGFIVSCAAFRYSLVVSTAAVAPDWSEETTPGPDVPFVLFVCLPITDSFVASMYGFVVSCAPFRYSLVVSTAAVAPDWSEETTPRPDVPFVLFVCPPTLSAVCGRYDYGIKSGPNLVYNFVTIPVRFLLR